ncbi:rhamnan synthesis F family protein [Xanthobacter pseudotagetidis]|uniref:rhamnan synthesis F family protein n=1 Tax=Xanthobacter pseudotagetidis TaxID=3119911 RepID=UPI003728DC4D
MRRANVNPILVCNGAPRGPALARLRAHAHRILVRRNVGRDIGAYRAATLYLNEQQLPASRVLYFNDSVIYLAGPELDRMVRQLAEGEYPVIGTFENHEFEHHIGSYAFSISAEVFGNRRMLKFWRAYRPYDVRPHAIHHGEIGLSRRMKKLGFNIDVIYSVDRLSAKLHAMDAVDILGLVKYMPMAWRSMFLDRTRQGPLGLGARLRGEFAARPPAPVQDKPRGLSTIGTVAPRPRGVVGASETDSAQYAAAQQELSKLALIDLLLGEISVHSQVHSGFGVYHVLMGAPLVKKDLLQRGIWVEHDCSLILSDMRPDLREAVMRQLINRGRPVHVRGIKRFMLHHGLE